MPKITFNRVISLLAIAIVAFVIGRYFYMRPGLGQEEVAPPFSATLQNGQPFELQQLRGHYVLIDFWGSWCAPCRRENPGLVNIYQQYHGRDYPDAKGFEIVSVGVEENRQRWERAIEQDGLRWPYHIYDEASSLRFFDAPIAQLYGVRQVPTKYFLDPEGRIIAVNPSLAEISRELKQAQSN